MSAKYISYNKVSLLLTRIYTQPLYDGYISLYYKKSNVCVYFILFVLHINLGGYY